ncbi:hypothetical protein CHL78_008865 [Romboutsia weinsteinii]|uniref:Uncharacterized protein n=1 Tax=Romboutsia weinsteinii TaxID=2020949 RepID=A0A371J4G8_9FIRM|nr:hypothetical protein [Romboutsia weinsteinii]RDY27566.1 hypothetical protein CHL78_008865 [Romboutsia weinsteinii]
MNKALKKSSIIIILIAINIIVITGCSMKKTDNFNGEIIESPKVVLKKENANALNIENREIVNISNSENLQPIKIKNVESFDIYKISLKYEELDENKNVIVESKTVLDMTLSPGETAYVWYEHQKYTDNIRVVGYRYETDGQFASINFEKDTVNIKESKDKLEDSNKYEILAISDMNRVNESKEGDTYKVKVRNSSPKDLGNIILKIGELNEDGEYINVSSVASNRVLRSEEEIEIDTIVSNKATASKVIGYTYDDPQDKMNVVIDLKSHKAKVKS